ncbi:hypothetical protein OSTOST_03013 [Ostertagia ostertagi]
MAQHELHMYTYKMPEYMAEFEHRSWQIDKDVKCPRQGRGKRSREDRIVGKIFIIYAVSLAVFIFGIGIAIASLFVHIKWLGVIFSAIVCVLFMVHLALDTQTFAAGAMLMAICASVPPYTVALALVTTAVTCFAVVVFATQTLYDITSPQPTQGDRRVNACNRPSVSFFKNGEDLRGDSSHRSDTSRSAEQ